MNENNTMLLEAFYSQKIQANDLKARFSLEGKANLNS